MATQFMNQLSPSALFELEEHDDALACIGQGTASSCAFSIDTAHSALTCTEHTSSTNSTIGSTSSTISYYEHQELTQLGGVGSGTYCKVGMVSHGSTPEIFAQKSIDALRLRSRYDLNCAATELANEAKMLSSLDHENIIKLRGVSAERFSDSFVSGNGGYFLLMDILDETLRDRMDKDIKMKKQEPRSTSKKSFTDLFRSCKGSARDNNKKFHECQRLYNRIDDTVLGIARAMKYLHSKNIVLRDLKPENIGYENNVDGAYNNDEGIQEGIVKLFDFGMAAKVEDCDPDEICGSPRYMAPEVMTGKGYSLAVDVYSFGVILYELCSLKRPFEETFRKTKRKTNRRRRKRGAKSTIQDFYIAVAQQKIKPTDNLEQEVCCPELCKLIKACWDHDPKKRPTFDDILARLVEIFFSDLFISSYLENLRGRDSTGRRSISFEFDSCFDSSYREDETTGEREPQSYP
eukprot:CAMPEP_0116143960 /NCGR_PEP_ID=MMETSP0329-20121206/15729_1 /TAXON_ID=697910 /ORGANISM="Pseudo-nitzschia arenysensis, Strain B593" /LENGTH=462 /DNA_ID=CAMNT_0003639315 /DNA_START=26 /DNA_END=1414 /DNA_ORIENTATION=+